MRHKEHIDWTVVITDRAPPVKRRRLRIVEDEQPRRSRQTETAVDPPNGWDFFDGPRAA